jgi:hypothetical protein
LHAFFSRFRRIRSLFTLTFSGGFLALRRPLALSLGGFLALLPGSPFVVFSFRPLTLFPASPLALLSFRPLVFFALLTLSGFALFAFLVLALPTLAFLMPSHFLVDALGFPSFPFQAFPFQPLPLASHPRGFLPRQTPLTLKLVSFPLLAIIIVVGDFIAGFVVTHVPNDATAQKQSRRQK